MQSGCIRFRSGMKFLQKSVRRNYTASKRLPERFEMNSRKLEEMSHALVEVVKSINIAVEENNIQMGHVNKCYAMCRICAQEWRIR